MGLPAAGVRLLLALVDLALPAECAGCGLAGHPWCTACSADLRAGLYPHPTQVRPDPPPPGFPGAVAAGPYAGVLRRAVTAYKDGNRRDLTPVLGPLLRASVAAVADGEPLLLVPVPSSSRATRSRGDVPVEELARAALRAGPAAGLLAPALRPVRRLADQAGLGHEDRARNLDGAYAVPARWQRRVAGRRVLVVDDVVTTGATLAEAARALGAAGAQVAGAAVIAATQRRAGTRR